MTVGSVKGTSTTYQGSGLENSTSQKVSYEAKAPAAQPAKNEPRAAESAGTVLEVQEPQQQTQCSESVKHAVEEINKKAKNSAAIFGIHDETNRVTIKIVDKETKEVLKEFPPEETLDMIAKVWELAGLMVDEKR